MNPDLLKVFPQFDAHYNTSNQKARESLKKANESPMYIELNLKLCDSKAHLVTILSHAKNFSHIYRIRQTIIRAIFILDSRIDGAFSLAKPLLSDHEIKYPQSLFEIAVTASQSVTPAQISSEAVKFIRRTVEKLELSVELFMNYYMKELIQFIRDYCIHNMTIISSPKKFCLNDQTIALFSFGALLWSPGENQIREQLGLILRASSNIARNTFFNLCLLSLHTENRVFQPPKWMKVVPNEFDFDGSYSEHLVSTYLKLHKPMDLLYLKQIMSDFNRLNSYKPTESKGWLDTTLSTYEVEFDFYSHSGISLRAVSLKNSDLVVIESSAGPGKKDFIAETENKIITRLTPDKKVFVFDKQSWLEMNSAEKKLYLKSIGVTAQA